MRKGYDITAAKKNPCAAQLNTQITIRLDEDLITDFKAISEGVGIPYQSLINPYLRDCAVSHRKLNLNWKSGVFSGLSIKSRGPLRSPAPSSRAP